MLKCFELVQSEASLLRYTNFDDTFWHKVALHHNNSLYNRNYDGLLRASGEGGHTCPKLAKKYPPSSSFLLWTYGLVASRFS